MDALCLIDMKRTDMTREVAKQVTDNRIQKKEPSISAAHPLFRTNPTILSERYPIKRNTPTIEFLTRMTDLCNLGEDDCQWSLRYTSKHFHRDHRKCITVKEIPEHEHCVSSIRVGPCLLTDHEGERKHQCCVWRDEDTVDWPITTRREFDEVKIVEARNYEMEARSKGTQITAKLKDESHKIKEEEWYPDVSDDVFDGDGKWLKDDLSKGSYYYEVLKLVTTEDDDKSNNDDEDDDNDGGED